MGIRGRIGLIAAAMGFALVGRGCIVAPPPIAESVVAGTSKPQASAPGSAAVSDSSPTAVPEPEAAPPPQPPPPPQTAEERRAGLDKQLDDSLGAFDSRLKKEQQKTAEERDARQSTVATTTAASGASDGADGAGAAASEAPSAPPGGRRHKRGDSPTSHAGDLKSDKAAGVSGSASGNGAPASVVADGNDDDIVARRLRKAAEQETDPELKDKLWKEYVEYKRNAQVR